MYEDMGYIWLITGQWSKQQWPTFPSLWLFQTPFKKKVLNQPSPGMGGLIWSQEIVSWDSEPPHPIIKRIAFIYFGKFPFSFYIIHQIPLNSSCCLYPHNFPQSYLPPSSPPDPAALILSCSRTLMKIYSNSPYMCTFLCVYPFCVYGL